MKDAVSVAMALATIAAVAINANAAPSSQDAKPAAQTSAPASTNNAPAELDIAQLASNAGACKKGAPAWIASWCRADAPKTKTFTSTHVATSVDAKRTTLCIGIAVTDEGKGFVPSPIRPTIDAKGQYVKHVEFSVAALEGHAATDIKSVRISFKLLGQWRKAAWWGPTTSITRATFLDGDGHEIGSTAKITSRCAAK